MKEFVLTIQCNTAEELAEAISQAGQAVFSNPERWDEVEVDDEEVLHDTMNATATLVRNAL